MTQHQDMQTTQLLFLKRFNEHHKQNARIACLAVLLVLFLFAYWDIHSIGSDHPVIADLLWIRFSATLPIIILTYFTSSQVKPWIRLDILMTLLVLITCLTIVALHWRYFQMGKTLTLDSIILCLVGTYFLPNIFYWQKLTAGLGLFGGYFFYLFITEQPISVFIHSGVYLFSINLAGLIHSMSYDKERKANYEKTEFLKEIAKTDQLTGAENRHKFDERFAELLVHAKLDNQGIAVAIADIDFFKQYNDRYGHFAGDECLIKVAQAFLTMKRHPLDSCIRFGGEEFILIKYGVNFEESVSWGQKIISMIHKLNIPHATSEIEEHVTVSAGLIHWHPGSSLTRTQLMKLADEALYKAKANGRNQVHVHLPK